MLDIPDNIKYSYNDIKDLLKDYINKEVKIKYNLGRNKSETYKGKIINLYDYMFLVKDKNDLIRSYSYADLLTKVIKIYK